MQCEVVVVRMTLGRDIARCDVEGRALDAPADRETRHHATKDESCGYRIEIVR